MYVLVFGGVVLRNIDEYGMATEERIYANHTINNETRSNYVELLDDDCYYHVKLLSFITVTTENGENHDLLIGMQHRTLHGIRNFRMSIPTICYPRQEYNQVSLYGSKI
ncbi:unnamed protein product [Absidia cylindrospora]